LKSEGVASCTDALDKRRVRGDDHRNQVRHFHRARRKAGSYRWGKLVCLVSAAPVMLEEVEREGVAVVVELLRERIRLSAFFCG
jgi:hypothetical protein